MKTQEELQEASDFVRKGLREDGKEVIVKKWMEGKTNKELEKEIDAVEMVTDPAKWFASLAKRGNK